jgi:hypothetical protein
MNEYIKYQIVIGPVKKIKQKRTTTTKNKVKKRY